MIFSEEQGETGGGCKAKKMNALLVPSKDLTNIHSTCILGFELGLDRKNPSWIRHGFSDMRASRNGKKFQEEWQR
jgi:hypothetical protein